MKKLLAVLLVMSMVLVMFAACGSKTIEETTTAEETSASEVADETAAADDTAAADETAAVDETATDETVAATDENGETVTTAEGTADTTAADASAATTKAAAKTTAKAADVNVPKTTEEIVAYYNAARKATAKAGAPKGYQTMALSGDITGDGAIGTILKVLTPAAEKALSNNSKETDWIPAAEHADIKVSDVKSASAKSDGKGNVIINIDFKDQTDGPNGDSNNGGPVARGVGTLGSIDTALNELGAEITEGRDTVTLTYTNAYVHNVKVNAKTGTITGGEWHYLVKVKIVEAKAKLGISVTLKNLQAAIDYKVVI